MFDKSLMRRLALGAFGLAWTIGASADEPAVTKTAPANTITLALRQAHPATNPAAGDYVLWANFDSTPYAVAFDVAGNVAKVRGAYMGVGVEAPGEALRSQLKLPEGVGLVVNYVDEHSPSQGVLHRHDVLEKLDDQLLVNAEQLVTLIRLHKPGETVHVTLIRESNRMTAQVKLGEKEVPALSAYVSNDPFTYQALNAWSNTATLTPTTQPTDRATLIRRISIDLTGMPPSPDEVRNFVNDKSDEAMKKLIDRLMTEPQYRDAWKQKWSATTQAYREAVVDEYIKRVEVNADVVAQAMRGGPVTIDDGEKLMWLKTGGDGAPELTVVDRATGAVEFKGPIGTDEQWQKVPEDVRKKFEGWKSAMEPRKDQK
jgi:hypothetical protein